MTEHTKAQRLADILQYKIPSMECLEEAAAELRRLHALNSELVEALDDFSSYVRDEQCSTDGAVTYSNTQINRLAFKARAALAKAKATGKYNLARIAWELERTAVGDGFHGNALRAAKDIPGLTDDDRALLDRYATGINGGTDHAALQDLALRIDEIAKTKEQA